MKTIIFLTNYLVLVNCFLNPINKEINKQFSNVTIEKQDTSKAVKLTNGIFYRFIFIDSFKYKIEWGKDRGISKISRDTFALSGTGVFYLVNFNSEVIILQQNCGLKCKYTVILPLKSKQQEEAYLFTLAIDPKSNLIAYLPEDQKNFVIVENYINGKKIAVREDDLCRAATPGECIDSCYFERSELLIKWQGAKWKSNLPEPKERKIKLVF